MARDRDRKETAEGEVGPTESEDDEVDVQQDADRDREGGGTRRRSRRRQERMEKTGLQRRRKRLRTIAIVVLIVALAVVGSVAFYILRPEPTETVKVTTSSGSFDVEWSGKDNPIVVVETSMGTFELELFMDKCPQTAGNFLHLVEKGFYDGLIFHRVIANFMNQGGDPQGTGTGGPGYTIPDEDSALALKHLRGSLSMANSGEDTGGSQFFICVQPQSHLDGKHAVFGRVSSGMDVVDQINQVSTDDSDRPVYTVNMIKVYAKDV